MGKRNQGRPRKYGNTKNRIEIKQNEDLEEINLQSAKEQLEFFKTPKEIKDLEKLDLTKTYYAFSKPTFERLLYLKCTLSEMCVFYNMSEEGLRKKIKENYGCTFETIKNQYDELSKMSLRKTLYKLATRYPAVAIFLAKNELGMSENPTSNNLPVINLDTEMTEKESQEVIKEIIENE